MKHKSLSNSFNPARAYAFYIGIC